MTTIHDVVSLDLLHRLGWVLLHSVWQFTLIALVLAAAIEILRRRSASLRYVVCCAALSGAMLTSIVTFALVSGSPPDRAAVVASESPVVPAEPAGATQSTEIATMSEDIDVRFDSPPRMVESVPTGDVDAEPLAGAPETTSITPAADTQEPVTTRLPRTTQWTATVRPWLPAASLVWLSGVLLLSLWNVGGWLGAMRLRHLGVTPVTQKLADRVEVVARRLRLRQVVHLLRSTLVDVPVVIGWWRPVLLVPAAMITGLSPQQVDAVLAHELAHVRRYDYLVNILQTIVETLLFYHPAVWWISHQIRVVREHCCDDAAIGVCGDGVEYASALASFEALRSAPRPALAANAGNTLARVQRILGVSTQRDRLTRSLAGSFAVAAIIAVAIAFSVLAGEKSATPAEAAPASEPRIGVEQPDPTEGSATASGARTDEAAWGKPADGLRARISLPEDRFSADEPMPCTLQLQNVSDRDVSLWSYVYVNDHTSLHLTDQAGQRVRLAQGVEYRRSFYRKEPLILKPGQIHEVTADIRRVWRTWLPEAEPRTYWVTWEHSLALAPVDEKRFVKVVLNTVTVSVYPEASEEVAATASQPDVSVRKRLLRAIQVSRQLAGEAHEGVPKGYEWIAPTAMPEDRKQATLMRFPRTAHVEAVTRARPWIWRYVPQVCSRLHPPPADLSPWPTMSDAAELRNLLAAEDPAVRAMAAEALATLRQQEDVQRISKLVTDAAEAAPDLAFNHTRSAKFSTAEDAASDAKPTGLDLMRCWHRRTVAAYARRAIEVITGERPPREIHKDFWSKNWREPDSDFELLRMRGLGFDREDTDPDVGPALVNTYYTRQPLLHVAFPFPYDEQGKARVRRFNSRRGETFRVLGANDHFTVLVSVPPGREARAAEMSEKITYILGLVPVGADAQERALSLKAASDCVLLCTVLDESPLAHGASVQKSYKVQHTVVYLRPAEKSLPDEMWIHFDAEDYPDSIRSGKENSWRKDDRFVAFVNRDDSPQRSEGFRLRIVRTSDVATGFAEARRTYGSGVASGPVIEASLHMDPEGEYAVTLKNVGDRALSFIDIEEGLADCDQFYRIEARQRDKTIATEPGRGLYAPAGDPKIVRIEPRREYSRTIRPEAYGMREKPPFEIRVCYRPTEKAKELSRRLAEEGDVELEFATNWLRLAITKEQAVAAARKLLDKEQFAKDIAPQRRTIRHNPYGRESKNCWIVDFPLHGAREITRGQWESGYQVAIDSETGAVVEAGAYVR